MMALLPEILGSRGPRSVTPTEEFRIYTRFKVLRAIRDLAVLGLSACAAEPILPPITRLAIYGCGNAECTQLGARIEGLPPQTGLFMVGAWFKGVRDVHWTIRWNDDSVHADFT